MPGGSPKSSIKRGVFTREQLDKVKSRVLRAMGEHDSRRGQFILACAALDIPIVKRKAVDKALRELEAEGLIYREGNRWLLTVRPVPEDPAPGKYALRALPILLNNSIGGRR